MQDRPTERVRVLLDGLTASAIVDRVHPYYSGYQFEGEWLDTLKESIEGELDDLDRIIRGRAGTVGYLDAIDKDVEELREREYRNGREDAGGAAEFADRLCRASERREDVTLWGVDYMPNPLDADGKPIHVGDVMENIICQPVHREVTGVGVECFYGWDEGNGRYSQFDANCYRHLERDKFGCGMSCTVNGEACGLCALADRMRELGVVG